MCIYKRVSLCVLLLPVCIPAFIKYVITHIRALLINKHKHCFLFLSCLLFSLISHCRATGSREDSPADLQKETVWKGERQVGSRVTRKADRSYERKFLGWETKNMMPCPIPFCKDGWNKGGGKVGTEEDEWCGRYVACWSIHERCREQKVDRTHKIVFPFLL